MFIMTKIPFVKIEAKTNFEFGNKLGLALKNKIKKRIEANKKIYAKRGNKEYSILIKDAKKFLPATKKKYPNLIKELNGIAKGAQVSFDDLLVYQCEEEILDFYIPKCTSVALRLNNGNILLGHNEDWLPEYKENSLVIISGKINKNKFLTMSYIGQLPGSSCALNSHGLAFTGNSLDFKRFKLGIPRVFMLRALLDTEKLKEAEKLLENKNRSLCSNTMLVWKHTMEDLELLWHHTEMFKFKNFIVHTNHPLDKQIQNNYNTHKESLIRVKVARKILDGAKRLDVKALKKVLCDHKSGICGHADKRHPRYGVTIGSAIINPNEGWLEACYANPCINKYIRYYLQK